MCMRIKQLLEAEVHPVQAKAKKSGKPQRPPISQEERRPFRTQLSCEARGLLSRAGPGKAPCSIHGPRSAILNSHFNFPLMQPGGWGPPQTLLPFLKGRPRLHPVRFGGRGGFLPSLHFPPPASCHAGRAILHPLSGQEVEALLSKGAIEEVLLFPLPLCYISPIFLVPKKSGVCTPF
jgi:hypothetical protein